MFHIYQLLVLLVFLMNHLKVKVIPIDEFLKAHLTF